MKIISYYNNLHQQIVNIVQSTELYVFNNTRISNKNKRKQLINLLIERMLLGTGRLNYDCWSIICEYIVPHDLTFVQSFIYQFYQNYETVDVQIMSLLSKKCIDINDIELLSVITECNIILYKPHVMPNYYRVSSYDINMVCYNYKTSIIIFTDVVDSFNANNLNDPNYQLLKFINQKTLKYTTITSFDKSILNYSQFDYKIDTFDNELIDTYKHDYEKNNRYIINSNHTLRSFINLWSDNDNDNDLSYENSYVNLNSWLELMMNLSTRVYGVLILIHDGYYYCISSAPLYKYIFYEITSSNLIQLYPINDSVLSRYSQKPLTDLIKKQIMLKNVF